MRLRPLVRRLFAVTLVLAVLGTALAATGSFGRVPELASNFRLQYVVVLALGIAWLLGRRRWVWAALLVIPLAANVPPILPFYRHPATAPALAGRLYRAMLLNVHYLNNSYDETIDLIRKERPDFVLFLEVTPAWKSPLESLHDAYPYLVGEWRSRHGQPDYPVGGTVGDGMALMSRLPLAGSNTHAFGSTVRPLLTASLRLPEGELDVVGIHPYASREEEKWKSRRAQMLAVARFAAGDEKPLLVLGDLNVTAWSPLFREMMRVSGLTDARLGHGVDPSWPTYIPFLWMPIDHVLASKRIAVRDFRLGPFVGSDHFPVLVDFSIR